MFKLKPGNVFQKINKMDRKQAYTVGAIVLVCFIALLTLASFLGDAEDTSFEDFNTRGYDLAQMPFLNDEAEEYLLASKYPDMQGNNSTMLYSAAEKEARQEEDAANAEAEASEETAGEDSSSGSSYSSSGYGGYSGYGGGRTATPTQVGKLGSASMSHAGGSGVSGTWGAPRGDFSPYKSQEKGSETPMQLKNQDARRALSQFAQGSRAAAGFRDSKGANAKRAMMGANVAGSDAFADGAVDLSKTGGLAIDPNAPVSSSDLGNIDDKVAEAANKGKEDKDKFNEALEQNFWEQLGQQILSGLADIGVQQVGKLLDQQVNQWQANMAGNSAFKDALREQSDSLYNKKLSELTDDDIEMLTKSQPLDRSGNAIDWSSLKANASPGQSVGSAWSDGSNCKNCQKDFFNGKVAGDNENLGMNEYYRQDTSSKEYQTAAEKREATRSIRLGRNSTGNNAISRGLQDAPPAPGGSNSSSSGSTRKYNNVGELEKSGMTAVEQVSYLQKEFGLSKEAAESQVYKSAK